MDLNRFRKGEPQRQRNIRVEITWSSIFRVMTGILLAYLAIVLWPIFKLLLLSIFLAVALYPMVSWTCRKGQPRWVGLTLASGTLLAVVVACFTIIGPMVYRQAAVLGSNLPKLREQVTSHLGNHGVIRSALEKGMSPEALSDSQRVLEQALLLVKNTVGGLFEFFMVIALAIYLMVDGPRALKWLIVFFPKAERRKVALAFEEVSGLVFAYMAGQFFISALAAAFVFVLLTALGVPMALLLGIIAGICDVVPVVGFFVAVALMMTVAMTVSPTAAVLVFVFYGPYHLFENFFLIPRVYGRKLRISPVAVPLAIAAGVLIAGIIGAIAVLPIVAAYPVIERLWLAPRLEMEPDSEEPKVPGQPV